MSLTIGMLVFDDMEELDLAGPWEVLCMASADLEDVRVVTISQTGEAVRCAHGLRLLPDHALGDAPDLDVVLVPGGIGTRREVDNPILVDWLRETGARCRWVTSVCTGALLLGAAGFLEGRRCTTHWAALGLLRERVPGAQVVENVRYVQDGHVVTAAGVSAGIDMALWLVGQIWDEQRARNTQRAMQYEPAPPYASAAA